MDRGAAAGVLTALALVWLWPPSGEREQRTGLGGPVALGGTRGGLRWPGSVRTKMAQAAGAPEEPSHTPPVPVPAPGAPGSAAVGIAQGTLAQASPDELTLEVPGHAPIHLAVGPGAAVRLDGRPVSASQLPIGADVEARYRVEDERAIAVRIVARRPGARGLAPLRGSLPRVGAP